MDVESLGRIWFYAMLCMGVFLTLFAPFFIRVFGGKTHRFPKLLKQQVTFFRVLGAVIALVALVSLVTGNGPHVPHR